MSLPQLSPAATLVRRDLLGPRALNPQPLPPRAYAFEKPDPIGPRALNPQPLPPKAYAFEKPDPIGPRALNPQPLPPRERLVARELFSYAAHASTAREAVVAPRLVNPLARFASAMRAMFGR